MDKINNRAQGSFVGLAVGDALGQPTEGKTITEIKEKWGRIEDFLDDKPVGSDDTEYAIFNAKLLLKYGINISTDLIMNAWKKDIISQKTDFNGAGFSEMAAIENLRNDINPPLSGKHIHSWSDGLAMRAIPFGIVAIGNPNLAIKLAHKDGLITHSGEGIISGKAVSVAIATAMKYSSKDIIFKTVLNNISKNSWTYRSIKNGINIGSKYNNVWDALENLYKEIVVDYYYWPDLGPEALGLVFGLLAAGNDFEEIVLGGVNIGRDTDTVAGIAGAIVGAQIGINNIPKKWANKITNVDGVCIDTVKGTNIRDIAIDLGELAKKLNRSEDL